MSADEKAKRLMRAIGRHLGGLLGGVGSLVAGVLAFIDDFHDFPKLDRIHHWQLGVLGMVGGLISLSVTVFNILRDAGLVSEE